MIIDNPKLEEKFKDLQDKISIYLKNNLSKSDEKKLLRLILKDDYKGNMDG